jgi:hypothetical protein
MGRVRNMKYEDRAYSLQPTAYSTTDDGRRRTSDMVA